jgi:hypothetical protein
MAGAQGRNRTTDTVIFSHVLYQLSYLGGGRGSTIRAKTRLIMKPRGAGKRLSAEPDDATIRQPGHPVARPVPHFYWSSGRMR